MAASCRICSAPELRFQFLWDGHSTYRCRACGVESVEPQPTRVELIEFYRQKSGKKMVRWETRLEKVKRSYESYLAEYSRLTGRRPRRFLDVGGGVGYYVRASQSRGIDSYLADWAIDALRFGREVLGVRSAVQGDIQRCGELFRGAPFDFVLTRHCIEHLPDPHAFLDQIAGLLAAGGVFQIETPDITSWEQWCHPKIMSLNYACLRRSNPTMSRPDAVGWALRKGMSGVNPPKHLWGFTPRGLSSLLEEHGFQVLAMRRAIAGSPVFDPLYYDSERGPRSRVIGALYRGWERLSSSLLRGHGMNLVVWAQHRA